MNFRTISKDYPLVLASSSPRRRRLLAQVGLPFRVLAADLDENHSKGDDPEAITCLLAKEKALAVCEGAGAHWILGADTVVVLGDIILGKPSDREEARSMLLALGGREHRVITGFCVLDPRFRTAHLEAVTTLVRMKALSTEEIEAYIDTNEPFGKAGSYAIQGVGAFLIEAISGSYTNVVGLPLCAVIKSLAALGALENFPLSFIGP